MENRHGLVVDTCLTPADGHAELAALAMIEPRADRPRAITLGADKAYDAEDFVNELGAGSPLFAHTDMMSAPLGC